MKRIIYTCDTCEKTFSNDDHLITLGSEDGQSLKYKNNTGYQKTKLIEMNKMENMHFCSKQCFIDRFFFQYK